MFFTSKYALFTFAGKCGRPRPCNLILNNRPASCSAAKSAMSGFCLGDYDCVGFDLDHTVCRYKLDNLFPLIYSCLCKYLVDKKGYNASLAQQPFEDGGGFLLKGLCLDVRRGNVLKVGRTGSVLRASHGTKMMTPAEVDRAYGRSRSWGPLVAFRGDMCGDAGSGEFRFFKDYFDMPAVLVAARMVDLLDRDGSGSVEYRRVGTDVLEALLDMYKVEGFARHTGGFFPALREDPSAYLLPCGEAVKAWLLALRSKGKPLFLITGSNEDFASFLGEHCLGADWESYFDVRITYAKKPGFFTGRREFLESVAGSRPEPVEGEIGRFRTYSRGNYAGLLSFLETLTGRSDPRVVYFGDNLVQDVLAPAKYSRCHAVAVVEEMEAEGMRGAAGCAAHPAARSLKSDQWGSFFFDDASVEFGDSTVDGVRRMNTLWADVVAAHSQIAVPSLDVVARLPADARLSAFNVTEGNFASGFYPGDPESLYRT